MLSLGYDIGSSSIKCAVFECATGKTVAHASHPPEEMAIQSPQPGWAEQDPALWWKYVVTVTKAVLRTPGVNAGDIGAIGVSYQMHGLVVVDRNQHVLRPSIIWCDSRAVDIGRQAFAALGEEYCLPHLLNSPGNFTASKLRWVREHEPDIFRRIDKSMLPGEFIAMKLSGGIVTTVSGLSEGIYWDFRNHSLAERLLQHYGIDERLLPPIRPTFSVQGEVTTAAAAETGLRAGTPVSYRAGDQPNNAFSLNVLEPGDVAATAGTSGVVYGVIDAVRYDPKSRVNPFAHVNHTAEAPRPGVLLCINGTGILNSWLRRTVTPDLSYAAMDTLAAQAPVGSGGVTVIPFGNGAERILENRNTGCHIAGLDFNRHARAHLLRASQEGIAFSFKYGIDIMQEMGMRIRVIRAGNANMFLSPVFRQTLADVTGATIELYDTDGAVGAARGAAVGAGLFSTLGEAFGALQKIDVIAPTTSPADVDAAYQRWTSVLHATPGE